MIEYIQANNRNQLEFYCLEEVIEAENPARFIEAFVDKLELGALGFLCKPIQKEGRPAFDPKVFLKLYLYGYLNGIRSSRRLEKECCRNIELHWLLGKLKPNYHSIADFRKENPLALRNTFKLFVLFLSDVGLIAGKVLAVDGTKMRASNSKKNNYSPKKIERHLAYIEQKTQEYMAILDAHDHGGEQVEIRNIPEKLARLESHKIKYELLGKQMEDVRSPQVSTTDADARALLVQGQVVEVCYNMQAAVDEQHKLVVATHTINRNDRNALSDICIEAKNNLGAKELIVLSDKGYHNGHELEICRRQNIKTICAQQEIVNSNSKGTRPEYLVTEFTYNASEDTYTCPQEQKLKTSGTWHTKINGNNQYRFKKYRTPACKGCAVKHLCTGRAQGGREIDRSEYADAVEENRTRYKANETLYRKRQEINEHIFGTIKRKWGYSFTDVRGLKKVNGEFALILTVYNIRRCISILGIPVLLEKMKSWKPDYKRIRLLSSRLMQLHDIGAHFEIFLQKAA
jgi:transposase